MDNPILDWLSLRLARSAATFQELADEGAAIGVSKQDLLASYARLHLRKEIRTPDGSKPYEVWALPPDFQPPVEIPGPPKPVEVVPEPPVTAKKKARDGKAVVERAKQRLQRNSGAQARYLLELTRRASDDAQKCPTCGRGTPRAEELRLKAVLAVLDRAGVVPPRAGGAEGGESGPVIVFPVGTKIAIAAVPPDEPLRLPIRADDYGVDA